MIRLFAISLILNYAFSATLPDTLSFFDSDSQKVHVLSEIAFDVGYFDPDSGLVLINQAQKMVQKLGLPMLEAGVYSIKAITLKDLTQYDSALYYYHESADILKEQGVTQKLPRIMLKIAGIYIDLYQYDDAMEYLQLSRNMMKEYGDSTDLANWHSRMGSFYYLRGNLYRQQEESDSMDHCYYNAEDHYLKALNLHKKEDYERGIKLIRGNLSLVYAARQRYQEAITEQKQVYNYFVSTNQRIYEVISLAELANMYKEFKKYDSSVYYGYKGIALAKELNSLADLRRIYQVMSRSYRELNRFDSAYKYSELDHSTHSQYLNEQSAQQIQLLKEQFRDEQKQARIDFLSDQNKLQDKLVTQSRLFALLSIVGFLITLILFFQLRKRNLLITQQREDIYLKNEELINSSSEVRKQAAKLQRINVDMQNLITIVAHDLKSPFNKIKGLVELIPLVGPVNGEQKELYKRLDSVIDSGRKLIRELNYLHEVEQAQLQPEKLEMNQYLHEVLAEFQQTANKKHIRINLEKTIDCSVEIDEGCLKRILDNLISNAIKFSEKRTNIWIKLSRDDDHFTVEVKDEGPGMTDEDKKLLFKRFQKLSARPTGDELSTGLGLSIVKDLVMKLNGKIEVESTPGKGSSFFVKLPMQQKIQLTP